MVVSKIRRNKLGLLDWLFCKHRRAVHLLAFGVKLRDSEGSYLYRCQDCGKVFWSDKRHNNITELYPPHQDDHRPTEERDA